MSENLYIVTDGSFEADVIQSSVPVIVDFWAEWCRPCQSMMPIIEDVAKTYQGKVKFCKLNVDDNSEIPAKFGIRGIPTLILFRDGQVQSTQVGMVKKSELITFIDENI